MTDYERGYKQFIRGGSFNADDLNNDDFMEGYEDAKADYGDCLTVDYQKELNDPMGF